MYLPMVTKRNDLFNSLLSVLHLLENILIKIS